MRPFRPPLLREDARYYIREARAETERVERCHAEIKRAILESQARLAETREILVLIDAALARFNGLH
jgi:hypothetical protein